MSVCVPNDNPIGWTDKDLLYKVAFNEILGRFITILEKGTTTLPRVITSRKEILSCYTAKNAYDSLGSVNIRNRMTV